MNFISVEDYFTKNVEDVYLCKGCKSLLLFNPCKLSCGCARFCANCVVSKTCMDCGQIVKICPDKKISKAFKRIELKCIFDECTMKIVYDRFLNHITNCDFRTIECKDCNQTIIIKEMNHHKTELCEYRQTKCRHCSKMTRMFEHTKYDESTPPDCDKLIADCPKCQTKDVNLKKHFHACCIKPCSLRDIGCTGLVKNGRCSSILDHERMFAVCLRSFNSRIENGADMDNGVKVDENIQFDIKVFERLLSNIREQMKMNIELIHSPRIGVLLWRIDNVDQVLNSKGAMLSDSMYSSEHGYRLCIKIYPQGNGIGKETFLSIYYVVMKGDYDAILHWPFNKAVTLSIFNQFEESKTKRETFKPELKSVSCSRPITDMNTATGNPTFIRRDELMTEKGYIKDNVLFIEISIDDGLTFL